MVLAGQVTVGAVWSTTVAVNVQLAELPAASVENNVTVFAPKFKVLPVVGVCVTVGVAQLSEVVAKEV